MSYKRDGVQRLITEWAHSAAWDASLLVLGDHPCSAAYTNVSMSSEDGRE